MTDQPARPVASGLPTEPQAVSSPPNQPSQSTQPPQATVANQPTPAVPAAPPAQPAVQSFTYSQVETPENVKVRRFPIKIILLLGLILVLVGGGAGGFFFLKSSRNQAVKSMADEQLTNLADLEASYAKIIEVIKRDPYEGQGS